MKDIYVKQILSEILWRYEDGAFSGNANIMLGAYSDTVLIIIRKGLVFLI